MAKNLPRVFVGTLEIAGMMNAITHCLQQQGFDTDLYLFQRHEFSYSKDSKTNPLFERWLKARDVFYKLKPDSSELKKEICQANFFALYEQFFAYLLETYDVFIFNGWNSIFPDFADLPILKRVGKRIIMFLLGSEGRPAWMNGKSKGNEPQAIQHDNTNIFNALHTFEQYCDCIVSHGPTSQFLSKPFLPLLSVGIPCPHVASDAQVFWPERPMIMHAPSTPLKGTAVIQAAVETLRTEGFDFDYIELSGQPNSVILEHLARCTFVVDELYSDSLLAGLGTEAAHFGKATLVGSLPSLAETMLGVRDMPPPPCEFFHDGNPLPGMRRLLQDTSYARQLGQHAKDHVTTHWSTEAIGKRLSPLVLGDVPESALFRPEDITYFRGWGLSDEQFKDFVSHYISTFGHEALLISDKPQLLLSLLRWLKKH